MLELCKNVLANSVLVPKYYRLKLFKNTLGPFWNAKQPTRRDWA